MDVSIIIVNWNTKEILRDCLGSVYEQAGEVESNVVEKNIKITEGPLKLPPGLPQGEPIEVTFRLSADGRLKVTGRHKAETLELEAKVEGVMSKEEISEAKPHLQKIDVS